MNDLVRPSHYGPFMDTDGTRGPGRPPCAWTSWGRSVRPATSSRSTGAALSGARRPSRGAGSGSLRLRHDSNYNSRPRPAEVMVDGGRWGWPGRGNGTTSFLPRAVDRRRLNRDPASSRHSDHRFRLTVHAAHRPPRAGGTRVLRDPSADATVDWIRDWKPTGIILVRRPELGVRRNVPTADPELLDVAPGARHLLRHAAHAHLSGGEVIAGEPREYGRAELRVDGPAVCSRGSSPGRRRRSG